MGTVQIANYKLAEQIYESDISLVYKTKKAAQAPQTILKVLKSGIPSDKELVRFHQEFKHTNQIDSPYVIKVWGIVQTPELAALAVEDFDGESLALTVKRNQLSLLESLDIAIDVVKGLRDIHQ